MCKCGKNKMLLKLICHTLNTKLMHKQKKNLEIWLEILKHLTDTYLYSFFCFGNLWKANKTKTQLPFKWKCLMSKNIFFNWLLPMDSEVWTAAPLSVDQEAEGKPVKQIYVAN